MCGWKANFDGFFPIHINQHVFNFTTLLQLSGRGLNLESGLSSNSDKIFHLSFPAAGSVWSRTGPHSYLWKSPQCIHLLELYYCKHLKHMAHCNSRSSFHFPSWNCIMSLYRFCNWFCEEGTCNILCHPSVPGALLFNCRLRRCFFLLPLKSLIDFYTTLHPRCAPF